MPTSKRSRAPELRRGQLLDAAESVAIGKGLGSLTVAAVASSAGVAKGTTYLYFSSKDELIDAVRDRYLERFLDAIETDDEATSAEQIAQLIRQLFDFSASNHALHHALFHEAGFGEEHSFEPIRKRFADIVAAGIGSGEFRAFDPSAAASFVVAGVHGVLVEAAHSDGARRNFAEAAVALALQSLDAHCS